jgi:hypothetical protein
MLATPSIQLELEQENARLQRLVAELLARNQELRQALESACYPQASRYAPIPGSTRHDSDRRRDVGADSSGKSALMGLS